MREKVVRLMIEGEKKRRYFYLNSILNNFKHFFIFILNFKF